MRRRAEACGGKLQAGIEIAQRDVDAAQHERQHQHDMAGDDRPQSRAPSDLGDEDQEAEPDVKCGMTSGDTSTPSIARLSRNW